MAAPLFTACEYLRYLIRAQTAHGLHSPFLFDLYQQVIQKREPQLEAQLQTVREHLLNSQEVIRYTNPKTGLAQTDTVRKLAKNVASSHQFSYFLVKLINHLGYQSVLETGTSVGINATYLAASNAQEVWTMEGSPEIAAVAHDTLNKHQSTKIHLKVGTVMDSFASLLMEAQPDLIFLDADHRSETIEFYLNTIEEHRPAVGCIVIHDIYWSADMKSAWKKILSTRPYPLTVDLFQAGLIFPHYPMSRQHFTIRF